MKRVTVFIFIVCCAVSALSLAEHEKKSKPPATVSPASEFGASSKSPATSTSAPTPSPTTKPSTTPTTTPTVKPTPTTKPTVKPTPTTKPTVKPPPTTKPTVKPTPTSPSTTPKPTTKPTPPPPKPTPSANLTTGNYNLTKNNKVCLLAQMAVQIRLTTPKANGTFLVQPQQTHAQGFCDATKANLTLVFTQGFITFMFNKSAANNTGYVNAVSFKLSYPISKNATTTDYSGSISSVYLFAAKLGHCYSCKSESIDMGKGLYLDINQDRVQAFNVTANEFGASDPCPADKSDYRVAIAVGVTLLVLIVIVVIAYLLGRKKRTDGYQSL